MLSANGLSRLTAIGLAKNPDDFFRAMGFAFHKRSSIELRNTHTNNGANSEGHARVISTGSNTMKRINQLAAFALALVVVGGTLSETDAQRRGRQFAQNLVADENVDGVNDSRASRHRRGGHKRGRAGFADQLTAEQHSELKDQLSALRASGASAAEISAALTAELTAAGLELPEDFTEHAAQHETQRTERTAQREEIKALADGLKAEGATRAEIRLALKDAGYEKPRQGRKGGRRSGKGSMPTPETGTPSAE